MTIDLLADILEGWDFWQAAPHDREPPRDAINRARAYLATTEPGKPESGVLAEAAAGYLFEMRYESDRWSGTMFAEQINLPASDVRNVRPLYAAPTSLGVDIEALQRKVEELEAALKPFADAIYNDNGDITADLSVNSEDLVKAYFVLRRAALQEQKKDG